MSDDVTVDNGTGTGVAFDVATDDDGSGNHVQIVKLALSADGSRTAIGADANGLDVDVVRMPKGSKTFSDPAPTTTASEIVAANSSRKSVSIYNAGTQIVYLGLTSGVTASNGWPLVPSASLSDDVSTDAWYAITASGTGDLRIIEVA